MAGLDDAGRKSQTPVPVASTILTELAADRCLFLERLALATELPEKSLELLDQYARLLYDNIPTHALIAKGDRNTIYTRHILDSLNPLSLFTEPPGSVLDIGSGGGFPGIPLGIVWPDTKVVLLESRERKAAFLERTVRLLKLRNVRVACERLEEHSRKKEPAYDVLFIRAVAEVVRLIEVVAPSCLPGARWVYFAGGGIDREQLSRDLERTGRTGAEATGSFGGRLLHGLV